MDIVNQYRTKVQQAITKEEKKAIAAELHQLATTFNPEQREEYEETMRYIHEEMIAKFSVIDPVIQRAQDLLATIEARQSVQV